MKKQGYDKEEGNKRVELYTFYMTLGVIALFIVCVLLLVAHFLIELLILLGWV